jgi:EAL domain-containing protein (putative c-di-GMP-specific phosphodiesterase class I)
MRGCGTVSTLQRHEINPARLKLELTESMLVANINDIINKMNALSKIGVHFSLDDFGTGYSSLQYLKIATPSIKNRPVICA